MTDQELRDHYAGLAMVAIMGNHESMSNKAKQNIEQGKGPEEMPIFIAKAAFVYADAMMVMRDWSDG